MTRAELTASIKEKALSIGFTKVGVTDVLSYDLDADRFESWVHAGAHGLLSWMERNHDKRRDIRVIMPEARSVLSLALNYYHPEPIAEDSDHKISRYAWGTDYHEVIPGMLRKLLAEIVTLIPNAQGRYYTDTGPLLEKAIAERAGIGWRGKHTNVITREVGSWVFLAEMLLSIELEPDAPATDMCGTCTRCMEACPTGAITEAYQVDATRCLSYLTIELKAEHPIPEPFRDQMNGWIYGCDICQDVCPWNRFAEPTLVDQFAPRYSNLALTNEEIGSMAQDEFSERFRKSPIKRTKLAGLQRNARAAKR